MWRRLNIIVLLLMLTMCDSSLVLIRDLVQYNVAGHPTLHKRTNWAFDPDVGSKRSRLYQEVHGVHGEKALERLGLGIDGNDQERLVQQRARDEALNELNS